MIKSSLREEAAVVAFNDLWNLILRNPQCRIDGLVEIQTRLVIAKRCVPLLSYLPCDPCDIECMMRDIFEKSHVSRDKNLTFYVNDKTRTFFRSFEESKLGKSLNDPHFCPRFGSPMIVCTKQYAWMFIKYASLVILKAGYAY